MARRQSPDEVQQFNNDLLETLRSANIPIAEAWHPAAVQLIEKYTAYPMPTASTLQRICATTAYDECIAKLKKKAEKGNIWVSLQLIFDNGREIINFVFGLFGELEEMGKSYLLNVAVMSEFNADAIYEFFNDSLELIGENGKSHASPLPNGTNLIISFPFIQMDLNS